MQCPPGQYYDGRFCQTQGAAPGATPAAAAAPHRLPRLRRPVSRSPPGAVATTTAGPTAHAARSRRRRRPPRSSITPLGAQHAVAGAKPVGSAIAGNFQQGQSLEAQVQMNPSKCYTVVGVGLPPVTNLDISLVPASADAGPAGRRRMAADNTVGANAIVGDKPNCFKWAFPMSGMMKVIMTVSQGSGVAAAQVFEK